MKNAEIKHCKPPAKVSEIEKVLLDLDTYIIPKLSERVDVGKYSEKIANDADIFNLVIDGNVVGNLAIYLNRAEGFITSFVIHPAFQGMGYGKEMWKKAEDEAISKKIYSICLDVYSNNYSAQKFYIEQGFFIEKEEDSWIRMKKILKEEKRCLK